jgi:anthranilate/para-aminobenzoate synthase component I
MRTNKIDNPLIKTLVDERKELQERIDVIDNAIEAFQKVCKHKHSDGKSSMEYEGSDSHKDWYVCTLCGETDWS